MGPADARDQGGPRHRHRDDRAAPGGNDGRRRRRAARLGPRPGKLGSRRALGGALLLIAAGLGVMGLAAAIGSVPLIAIAFVVTGAGIGLLDVMINVEGTAVERTAGRTLMPRMHGAWSIGVAGGSGIGAACAGLGITPGAQFAGEAGVIAVSALAVAAGIPRERHEPASQPQRDRAEVLRQWLRGWLDWRLLLIGLVMLGCDLGEGGANSWLTLAARNYHGQSAAAAALFLTVFAACEALTRIFAGPAVDRLGRVRTTRVTTALGVAGIVAFVLGGNVVIILAGVAAWAIGVSMGIPLGMTAAAFAASGSLGARPARRPGTRESSRSTGNPVI
ncbi:MAG: MFS transporter [Nocardiopsaceae bacterium]|nr:MFS transporter [Nocardiopsaceae bacterium]